MITSVSPTGDNIDETVTSALNDLVGTTYIKDISFLLLYLDVDFYAEEDLAQFELPEPIVKYSEAYFGNRADGSYGLIYYDEPVQNEVIPVTHLYITNTEDPSLATGRMRTKVSNNCYDSDGNIVSSEPGVSLYDVLTERESVADTEESEESDSVDNVENAGNDGEYAELVSVPVDGRDGSKESPYRIGDTIYFPKVVIEYERGNGRPIYSSLTVVVEEATSEYVKMSYKFGVNDWEEVDVDYWSNSEISMDSLVMVFREDSTGNQVGEPLWPGALNDAGDTLIGKGDSPEFSLYYQDVDGKGCTKDTAYLMLLYTNSNIPEEDIYPGFNCTLVEITK